MDYIYELREMLCEELEQIAGKGELSISSLDTLHKITDSIKNLDKIEMYNEYEGKGGSYDDGSEYSGRRRYSRDDGNSYRRGSSRDESAESYRRGRNRMGQYTSRSNRGYSRESGKDDMIEQLHSMMENAETEKERESIQKCIKSLESA